MHYKPLERPMDNPDILYHHHGLITKLIPRSLKAQGELAHLTGRKGWVWRWRSSWLFRYLEQGGFTLGTMDMNTYTWLKDCPEA